MQPREAGDTPVHRWGWLVLAGAGALLVAGMLMQFASKEGVSVPVVKTPVPDPPSYTDHRLEELDVRMAEVISRLDDLSDEQQRLDMVVHELSATLMVLEAGIDTAEQRQEDIVLSEPEYDPEAAQREYEDYIQHAVTTLGARLNSEELDASWSAAAESRISEISEQQTGSRLSHVECRSTLCIVQTLHDNQQALDAYALELPVDLGWNSTMTMKVENHADDRKTSIIFISRDGYDLEY